MKQKISAMGSGRHGRGANLVITRGFSEPGTFKLRQVKGGRRWLGGEQGGLEPSGKQDNTCKGSVAGRRKYMPCAWRHKYMPCASRQHCKEGEMSLKW